MNCQPGSKWPCFLYLSVLPIQLLSLSTFSSISIEPLLTLFHLKPSPSAWNVFFFSLDIFLVNYPSPSSLCLARLTSTILLNTELATPLPPQALFPLLVFPIVHFYFFLHHLPPCMQFSFSYFCFYCLSPLPKYKFSEGRDLCLTVLINT